MAYKRLSEYCTIISGYAFKSLDLANGIDIPVIKIKNISNGGNILIDESTQYVQDKFLTINEKYHIKKGDILISLTGSNMNQPNSMVGRCCRSLDDKVYLLNQRAGKIIPKDNAIKNYLYYVFRLQSIQYAIVNRAYGSANQVNISPDNIMSIKFNIPEIGIQKKIADILSAYDDLIENNNKRIKILEQMAENLYKEWFVRFRFPGYEHKTTRDWQIKKAREIFNITIGKTPSRKVLKYFSENPISNYPWISISDIKNINTFVYKTKEYLTPEAVSKCHVKIIPKNTVILSFKLTVGKVAITTSDMCTNEAIAHFLINDNILKEYIYLYLKNFEYANLGNTSSIGTAINSEIVKNMKIILPTREILTQFHKLTYKYFENIRLLNELNINLIKQRDLLLPRLMSGKLKV